MLGAMVRGIEPGMQGTGSKTVAALLLESGILRPPRPKPLERLVWIANAVPRLEMIAYQEHDMGQLLPPTKTMVRTCRCRKGVGGKPDI